MKILLLDNYDSFTYNLLHLLEQFDADTDVRRNDQITLKEAAAYDRFVLSPGPGLPEQSGILKQLIKRFGNEKPVLGVCLGMQAIAEVCGGKLMNMKRVHHGAALNTKVTDKNENLFKNLPREFNTGRYHSWCIDRNNLPVELRVTATDDENTVMAVTHENKLMRGIQFHPESILTDFGKEIISNWINVC